MMSTPAATKVESVREKRAMRHLEDDGPIFGIRNLKRSHCLRPASVFFHLRKPKMSPAKAGKMM